MFGAVTATWMNLVTLDLPDLAASAAYKTEKKMSSIHMGTQILLAGEADQEGEERRRGEKQKTQGREGERDRDRKYAPALDFLWDLLGGIIQKKM